MISEPEKKWRMTLFIITSLNLKVDWWVSTPSSPKQIHIKPWLLQYGLTWLWFRLLLKVNKMLMIVHLLNNIKSRYGNQTTSNRFQMAIVFGDHWLWFPTTTSFWWNLLIGEVSKILGQNFEVELTSKQLPILICERVSKIDQNLTNSLQIKHHQFNRSTNQAQEKDMWQKFWNQFSPFFTWLKLTAIWKQDRSAPTPRQGWLRAASGKLKCRRSMRNERAPQVTRKYEF